MNATLRTLAVLTELQAQIETQAEKLLRDAKSVKVLLASTPLNTALPELLRELRLDSDFCKTVAQRLNSALLDHAAAEPTELTEPAKEVAARQDRPSKHVSVRKRVLRAMQKRGCLIGGMDAPGFNQ